MMPKFVDNFLNKITMYRLVLYYLLAILFVAIALGFFGLIPYRPIDLLYSSLLITLLCWIANTVFAWVFEAPTNVESVYITALILILIITPVKSLADSGYFMFVVWASLWAMASKFIFAIGKKHLFNPAAIAVALPALFINQSASWWVGTAYLAPVVLIGGILIVRKIRRFDLVFNFFVAATVAVLSYTVFKNGDLFFSFKNLYLNSPILFFAFVMLTEPLTTPPTEGLQIVYGALVGILFAPWVKVSSIASTPELALVLGNVFSYLVSPKQKLLLELKGRLLVARDTFDFIFFPQKKLAFAPGQYLEWTLGHDKPDSRGNRRYFTIASSPTEDELIMGVKFYPAPSSYKQSLAVMKKDDIIVASQLSGDFTMPKDKTKKLVFIAGGIGVTPFRSMVKYLIDKKEQRDIVFFYSNRNVEEIAYKDIFDQASNELGIKTVYTLTDKKNIPDSWNGALGYVDTNMLQAEVPDYKERMYYISGPNSMVDRFKKTLTEMGVKSQNIKTDFFPGFA